MKYFPAGDTLVSLLKIDTTKLDSDSEVRVPTYLLVALLRAVVSQLPFSARYYTQTYSDIADAVQRGELRDLHQHFIDFGFLEGRVGAPPAVDEHFYMTTYPDVAEAVKKGAVKSARDHYLQFGVAEGRIPSAEARADVERWVAVIRRARGLMAAA